jgi:hypothetical protein
MLSKRFKTFALTLTIVIITCAHLGWGAVAPPLSVTYRETTGDQSLNFRWELKTSPDIQLEVTRGEEHFLNRLEPSGTTTGWSHSSPQRDITAYRRENRIFLSGWVDGEAIHEEWTIDDGPWYQALSYCLRPFLRSDKKEVEFWMIRPDTINAIKMRAQKTALESITVDGRECTAWNVSVCRTGFLSLFWQGEYWYRAKDGLFLKYKGVHGPPGTPPTVVEVDFK